MESDKSGMTCIVTIHGVGFEQAPEQDVPGYADTLHTHLDCELKKHGYELSDDPDRQSYQKMGESVPIYVESVWSPGTAVPSREAGLERLGTWSNHHRTEVAVGHTGTCQKLIKGKARIAHIALVYSKSEGIGPLPGASVITMARAIANLKRYGRAWALLKMLYQDLIQPALQLLWAKVRRRPLSTPVVPVPSLRVRADVKKDATGKGSALHHPSGFMTILLQLQNDVAAYICHNGRRQRVRSFILEALLRLAHREDVSGIILNTHSNGTLMALDVLQELPPSAAQKIHAFITAGSPIRKYVDLFAWGTRLAVDPELTPWLDQWWNFYDERDFVADPLLPCAKWKHGMELTEEQKIGIYQVHDPCGHIIPICIEDRKVDNGVMQAHNYWDNTREFIPQVVAIVKNVVDNNVQTPAVDPSMPMKRAGAGTREHNPCTGMPLI